MTVSSGDKGTVGQQLAARIRAIRFHFVVHDSNAVLPFTAADNVFIGADPGDPVPSGGTDMGLIAKSDQQPAIRRLRTWS